MAVLRPRLRGETTFFTYTARRIFHHGHQMLIDFPRHAAYHAAMVANYGTLQLSLFIRRVFCRTTYVALLARPLGSSKMSVAHQAGVVFCRLPVVVGRPTPWSRGRILSITRKCDVSRGYRYCSQPTLAALMSRSEGFGTTPEIPHYIINRIGALDIALWKTE